MGVLVARLTGARDPRTVGSGRTGGTNALRAMGASRAVLVAALDVLKGALPVLAAILAGASPLGRGADRHRMRAGRLGVGFPALPRWTRGGHRHRRDVDHPAARRPARRAGLLRDDLHNALRVAGLAAGGRRPARCCWQFSWHWAGTTWPDALFGFVGAAIVWIAHHDNISRLLRGEERKFDILARGE